MIFSIGLYISVLVWPLILHYIFNFFKTCFQLKDVPGPLAFPFFGTFYLFVGKKQTQIIDVLRTIIESYSRRNGLCKVWIGKPLVYLCTPDRVECLLSSTKQTTKGDLYDVYKPYLRQGLLTSWGQKWQKRRKLLTPAFHFKTLKDYKRVMEDKTDILMDILIDKCHSSPEGFDFLPLIKNYALDVICEAAMGVNVDAQTNDKSTYVIAVDSLIHHLWTRSLNPFLLNETLNDIFGYGREEKKHIQTLYQFCAGIISQRKMSVDGVTEYPDDFGNKKARSFLDLLLGTEDLGIEDIAEEVENFMFAGHDTTATTLSWVVYNLARHPNIQNKAYSEILKTLSDGEMAEGNLDYPFLDALIKETLRLFPTVPFYGRKLDQDLVFKDGVVLPKGCQVFVPAFCIHRDPNHWKNPTSFAPDRFMEQTTRPRHPYAFIPFSAGPRNCIGQKFAMQSMKGVLVKFIKTFEILPTEDLDNLKMIPSSVLKPSSNVKVRLVARS